MENFPDTEAKALDARITYKISALNGGTLTSLDLDQWIGFDANLYRQHFEKNGYKIPENLIKWMSLKSSEQNNEKTEELMMKQEGEEKTEAPGDEF